MKKKCFVICPIGSSQSSERNHSDQLLNHILKPVALEHGYEISRADTLPKSGLITTQIITSLIDSDLVIADLTGGNPNVFYELAIRHATNKPYIQMADIKSALPFDIQGVRTIQFNLNDLDVVSSVKKELNAQITEILGGHAVDSPISIAGGETLLGRDSGALEVFLEKFWSIESSLGRLEDFFGETMEREEIQDAFNEISAKLELLESKMDSIESQIDSI